MRQLIKVNGDIVVIPEKLTIKAIEKLIGADCLDSFNLRDGTCVFVDDSGYDKNLPVNQKATELYLSICRPGTTHQILGNAVLCPDEDF